MSFYFLFFLGLIVLIAGSHFLIRAILALSHFFRIKPLFLSIVVLGFVTSSPEWFVTFLAAYKGSSDLALSNVIGSNTINILLVLGLVGTIYKFKKVDLQIIKFDSPCLLFFLILPAGLAYDGRLGQIDSLIILLAFVGYLYFLFQKRRKKKASKKISYSKTNLLLTLGELILGFVFLFWGSHLMIDNAVEIGASFGLSERLIGFLILALGTSLPELATSAMAAVKKEGEMILGNIIGSNIFNSLFVVGSAGLLQSLTVSSSLYLDYLFMFFLTLILWMVLFWFKSLPRMVSAFFLISYLAYISLIFNLVNF